MWNSKPNHGERWVIRYHGYWCRKYQKRPEGRDVITSVMMWSAGYKDIIMKGCFSRMLLAVLTQTDKLRCNHQSFTVRDILPDISYSKSRSPPSTLTLIRWKLPAYVSRWFWPRQRVPRSTSLTKCQRCWSVENDLQHISRLIYLGV